MEWDLSADPVAWASDRMQLVDELTPTLQARFVKSGQSYQELYDAFMDLYYEKARAAVILASHVGGIYVEQNVESASTAAPFTPVPLATQKEAVAELTQHIFSPNAFVFPPALIRELQQQRRGSSASADPDMHRLALFTQSQVIDRLVNARVLARVTSSRDYGNQYTADALLTSLTSAIFAQDMNGNVNTYRQALQIAYVDKLATATSGDLLARQYDAVARAAMLKQLRSIRDDENTRLMLRWAFNLNDETAAHRENVKFIVERALRASALTTTVVRPSFNVSD
jgi:hypothetical protein